MKKLTRTPRVKTGFLPYISIPKPPDYSTPEAITLRAQEAAWTGGCIHNGAAGGCHNCEWGEHRSMLMTMKANVKTDGKVYKDFMAAIAKAAAIVAVTVAIAGPAYADSTHTCQGNSCNTTNVTNATTNNQGGQGGAGGASESYSGVTNTNTNNYTGTNKQRQTQNQSLNNGQTIAPAQATSVSTSFSEPVQDRFAPPIAAPALTAAGTGVCLGSVSFGLSGPMAGVSAGWTKVDEGCETRSNAALLFNMGMRDAALRLMMTNPAVREAMTGVVLAPVSAAPASLSQVQGN